MSILVTLTRQQHHRSHLQRLSLSLTPDMVTAHLLGPDLLQSLPGGLWYCILGGPGLWDDWKGRKGLGLGEGH